jgi:hypothetical protein
VAVLADGNLLEGSFPGRPIRAAVSGN